MKRLLMVLVVLAIVAGISFAEGGQEETKPIEITWLLTGDNRFTAENKLLPFVPEGYDPDKQGIRSWQADRFMEENPGIKLTTIIRDVSKGSMTLDSMLAAGKPPDIIHDAAWLTFKYLNADYALPLEEYMDVSRFQDNLVELYSRGGHCYALVHNNITIGLSVNLDMLDKIGMALPSQEEWTTDTYDGIAEKLKAIGIPATVVMTQHGFGSWQQMWLQNAGGAMFSNGDHSKVTVNTPEYIQGIKYMKSLVDRGYTLPHPNECNDDTGIEAFAAGKIFSCTEQTGHVSGWMPQMIANGLLEEEFEYTFMEVPHASGLDHAPVSNYQGTIVAHKSNDEKRNLATVKLIEFIFREDNVRLDVASGTTPSLKGEIEAIGRADTAPVQAMWKLARTSPSIDAGAAILNLREITRAWVPSIHDYMNGKISAKELAATMEKVANKLLAEN